MNVRYDVVGVRNVVTHTGNGYTGIKCKLSLETNGQQCKRRSNQTYIKDMKDPVKICLPGRDLVFIISRIEQARERVALPLFRDLPLDPCYGSVVNCIVGESSKVCTAGLAHVVNWLIAWPTDRLRSSALFPFVPRSRAPQTSAQFSPRSI